MPKYLLIFVGSWEDEAKLSEDLRRRRYEAVGRWFKENDSHFCGGAQLQHPRGAKTVRKRNGAILVTDGPFIEAKEGIGGVAIMEVGDREVALELARSWPAGDVEVRPVVEDR